MIATRQPIAGVSPPETEEVTIMTVWPTIFATQLGRRLGRFYENRAGIGIFTLGKLAMLLSLPVVVMLYFGGLAPFVFLRYRLTNRRVIVLKGLKTKEDRWVSLSEFDAIDVETLPGQAWYPAGELIFRKGNVETFRLSGVGRPETFRRTCLKAQKSYSAVQRLMGR